MQGMAPELVPTRMNYDDHLSLCLLVTKMSLKFGLNIQKKGKAGPSKPVAPKRSLAFGGDDSEDEIIPADAETTSGRPPNKDVANKISSGQPPTLQSKGNLDSNRIDLSTLRAIKQRQAEAETIDASIYDYDAAFDALHAKSAAKKAAEKQDAIERKPKYMGNLLAAAEVRKRDQLRAQDRLLQKQREEEGEEFADKDAFVTEAYKAQQEEVKRMEAEEAKKEEAESKKRQGKGMTGFYRSVMEQEEQQHQEVVQAATEVKAGDAVESEPQEKSAAQMAKELNEQGARIMINEEGQVADKRQLLTAGLNVAPKRKADGTPVAGTSQRPAQQTAYRGRTEGQKAMRERQTRMMEQQLEAAAQKAAEAEAAEQEKIERASKSRKTDADVSSAKERYLQRKKEAAEAKARGEDPM